MKLATFEDDGYELDDAEERQREAPETFAIPAPDLRAGLTVGQIVKLIFRMYHDPDDKGNEVSVERMWVSVTGKAGGYFLGGLDNDPYCDGPLKSGDPIVFLPKHVIAIYDS